MNSVILSGRLTKDPMGQSTTSGMSIARFSLAVSRGKDKDGNEQTDYPNCVAFGKTAELVERYTAKGSKVIVQGRIQTGSYEKDGRKVYTTDVIVDRVEFMDSKKSEEPKAVPKTEQTEMNMEMIEDDEIPFGGC